MTITDLLAKAEELARAATPGPWDTREYAGKITYADGQGIICQHVHSDDCCQAIVSWRSLILPLLAVARAAQKAAHLCHMDPEANMDMREALAALAEVKID